MELLRWHNILIIIFVAILANWLWNAGMQMFNAPALKTSN
jgi:hypothetical protein